MAIDVENLKAVLRGRAMARLEAGLRSGGDWLCEILKATVDGNGASEFAGKAAVSPFIYVDENGKQRRGRRGKTWKPGVDAPTAFGRSGPPGMITGAGRESIGYQIVDKDFDAGTITLRIGVEDSPDARGGFKQLPGYMMGHELGIRRGKKGLGVVTQRPWLRVTVSRYWSEFAAIVILRARGLA